MMNTNTTTKENKMNTYAIYQVPEVTPMNLIRDISFFTPFEVEAVSHLHELVGTVEAKSLNEVFDLGNLHHWMIKQLVPMRSISVGDIIHNLATDETHMVDKYGFVKIDMKEAA
jgi:hypothetical protein